MMQSIAVTDLHGNVLLYELLLRIVDLWKITSVFITGDIAPASVESPKANGKETNNGVEAQRFFLSDTLIPLMGNFLLEHRHTDIYLIMGNDDRRANEHLLADFDNALVNFHLVDDRLVELRDSHQKQSFFPGEVPRLWVAGYPYVVPGASLLMDWVKYENRVELKPEGMDPSMDIYEMGTSTDTRGHETTIDEDLKDFGAYLTRQTDTQPDSPYDPKRTVHMFHSPPYNTPLDWTTPRGRYEFLPVSDHVGSVEIRRFIERSQPYLVLSGHCHESVVIGDYKVDLGGTRCVNPGSQSHLDVLSVVQFDIYNPHDMKQLFVNAR